LERADSKWGNHLSVDANAGFPCARIWEYIAIWVKKMLLTPPNHGIHG